MQNESIYTKLHNYYTDLLLTIEAFIQAEDDLYQLELLHSLRLDYMNKINIMEANNETK